jgi:hypothetical protein
MRQFFTKPSPETRRAETSNIMGTLGAYPSLTLWALPYGIGLGMSETLHLVYTPSVLSSSFDEDCY